MLYIRFGNFFLKDVIRKFRPRKFFSVSQNSAQSLRPWVQGLFWEFLKFLAAWAYLGEVSG